MGPRSSGTGPCCIAVDWSGARTGERSKLWLAEARAGRVARLEAGRTRGELVQHMIELAACEQDLVAGLDFAFSFPEWFVRAQGCTSAPELWDLVARDGERWLARCSAPFWGRPGRKRPRFDAERPAWRATEGAELPHRGIGPKSVFQIGGAGAVGTGSVRGMPFLPALARAGFAIWPFDAARRPLVLELYPRNLTGAVTKSSRSAREVWLSQCARDQDRTLTRLASASEDAFDAFASALAMSLSSFDDLEAARDERERIEGRIWCAVSDRSTLARLGRNGPPSLAGVDFPPVFGGAEPESH